MREISPTIMTLVPRLLEKVYAKMNANVEQSHGLKKKLASMAFKRATRRDPEKDCRGLMDRLYDRLVYSKLRAALGGKLTRAISGSAPLNADLTRFFINIGLPIYEGYGLTESSPVLSANYPGNNKIGTVGKAFPSSKIKISDKGEILAQGPNIMRGYNKNRRETEKAIDSDGWLYTGDKGLIDQEGYLTITGRLKEMFKTSGGKYVSPVPIEQALTMHEMVDLALVIAEGKKFVSCLLFPDLENLDNYKNVKGYGHMQNEEFLESDFFINEMNGLIDSINENLNHWEQVRKFTVINTTLSIDSGELTPSMKIRRHVIEEKYRDKIEKMYEEEKK
jgi:long-chain acyl-CoA synthetase